nr:hypothetical protein [Tanacetum cinerariifolium]
NNDEDAAFNEKEHDAKNLKSEVNVSPSSSAQSRKQNDKTKKKAKGKSYVEYFIENRDLSGEFKDYSDDSSNDVNAVGFIVPTDGQNSSNSTNPFSVAVSPIPTTRTHKDHPVAQIISDLSSTTQTKSMTRVINDQGRLSQIFNDDFHTYMFACFLSREEPKMNNDEDAAFNEKEHDAKNLNSEVNVSPSSSAQSRKQNDKTKKKAKGNSYVEYFIENRDLSGEFKDYSDDSSNDVNAAGFIVPTDGQNSSNSTNPFSVAGPSNTT